jgi:membrane-anchored glycerophosphoryl diester phosphodiesterase (GDPDase)
MGIAYQKHAIDDLDDWDRLVSALPLVVLDDSKLAEETIMRSHDKLTSAGSTITMYSLVWLMCVLLNGLKTTMLISLVMLKGSVCVLVKRGL